jgi:L-ribulose-5-phosphate 3-epimerase
MKDYFLGLYEKSIPDTLSLAQKIAKAGDVGYDYVELSIDESEQRLSRLYLNEKQLREMKLVVEDSPLPLGSICLSGHRKFPLGSKDATVRKKSLEIMERALVFASYMGIPVIQLAGYDVYYESSDETTRSLFIENLAICAKKASQYGIMLGFETMETPFMNSVSKALEYVKLINSPYLHVYPDLGNIVNAADGNNKKAQEDLLQGEGHLIATHIKESLPGIYREVPYGTGHVDFLLLLETCWSLGVRRYVTEFWHTSSNDWEQQLIDSYTYINSLFFAKK